MKQLMKYGRAESLTKRAGSQKNMACAESKTKAVKTNS
jgi:hypothetical protein